MYIVVPVLITLFIVDLLTIEKRGVGWAGLFIYIPAITRSLWGDQMFAVIIGVMAILFRLAEWYFWSKYRLRQS